MAEERKLRLIVVDDSGETREYLRRLLQFEQQIELVGLAANGQEGVNLAREREPDVVLMDINMPVMDGITAAEQIFNSLPNVRVVMMSVQSEMAYLRRAMQVGAREFLIKPFTHEELMNTLGEVSSLQPTPAEAMAAAPPPPAAAGMAPQAQGVFVSVFSPRGGAGCSTLATNLAIALAGRRQASALLVDANLRFGVLDTFLNLQPSRTIVDLAALIEDADPALLHEASIPHNSGIRLLAAPPSPEMADLVTPEQLQRIVELSRQRYEYTVADVGTNLDDKALTLLDAADRIIVPLTPDIPAVKNIRHLLEIAKDLDYPEDKVVLVLNRADPQIGITAEAIQRHIKHPVSASIRDNGRIPLAAINRGVPLIIYEGEVDKNRTTSLEIATLLELIPETAVVSAAPRPATAAAVEAAVGPEEPQPAKPKKKEKRKKGFFSRLLGRG